MTKDSIPVVLQDHWVAQRRSEHHLFTFHHNPFIHVYQHALHCTQQKFFIGQMYEDTQLPNRRYAENLYRFLLKNQPHSYMLIEAGGDKVDPPCKSIRQSPDTHLYCTTYDPLISFYLLPYSVWEQEREALLARDIEWYCHAMICRDQDR